MTVKRVGDSLNIENLPDGKTIEITKFYTDCSPATPCSLTVDPADGAAATTITQSTAPIATLGENQALMYGSAGAGAGAAPLSTGALLGIAAAGVALAAAGGGGGGGGSDHKDTTPPDAPAIDAVAGDNVVDAEEAAAGVTVSGRAEAGSSVAVAWGSTTKTATANADGTWSVKFESSEVPADGATKISAVATDAAGNASAAGTVDVTVDTSVADTTPPDAPTVNAVTGDNVIDATEAAAGVTVAGTAEAGSTVVVTWGEGNTQTTTADAEGNWSVTFASDKIPADGATTISAVATDAAGNASDAGTVSVAVDATPPGAPSIGAVAGNDVVNSSEAAAGVTVSGTAEAGSSVAVTWGDGNTQTATADGDGNWSVAFASDKVPADGTTTISAVATDTAGNASAATTHDVRVDTLAPELGAPVVGPDGSVSGTTEAGSTVTIGAQTATAGDDGSFLFAAGTVASGATATVNVTDAAGNAGAGVEVTAGTYAVGTGGNDVLFAGDAAFVDGGNGSDVLFGGSGGAVRNYQFDYWDASTGGSITYNGGDAAWDVVEFSPSARNGWEIGTDPLALSVGGGGTPVTQYTGGEMQLIGNGTVLYPPDDTGSGGRYYWDTISTETSGGATISQSILANPGDTFDLSMQVSKFDVDTSMQVLWDGAVLGTYDGLTDTWTGTPPTVTDNVGTSRLTWTWEGITAGDDAAAGTRLEIRSFGSTADHAPGENPGFGMHVDRITLDPTSAASGTTLVGGGGTDVLFGQAGDDVLYGGAYGDTPATADGVADAFVYSLRSGNGNDVIKDFQVGTDQIWLIDALDTYGAYGDHDADSHASRFPGEANDAGHVTNADFNLSFRDFVQADSAGQYLTVTDDGSGNVKIGFFGQDGSGAATDLGSVVLEGVAYGSGAGQYDSVESLFGTGFMQTNEYGSSVLYATIDGLGNERMVNNLMPV